MTDKLDDRLTDEIIGKIVSAIGMTDTSLTLVFDNNISLIIYGHKWHIRDETEDAPASI